MTAPLDPRTRLATAAARCAQHGVEFILPAHGHVIDGAGDAIAKLKADYPHHAVISAGDMVGASPLASALMRAGIAPTLIGTRGAHPALRIGGRRRLCRLVENIGEAPDGIEAFDAWPRV